MSVDTRIFDAYLECALWADLRDESGEPLDEYTIFDFGTEARDAARVELEDFVAQAGELLEGMQPAQIGHDFWLTRNGHGAGFWDRGLGARGEELTRIAKSYSERSPYVGDDGKVYFT